MCIAIETPDFLTEVTTPGTFTEEGRQELRGVAVHLLVDNQKLQRGGYGSRMHYLLHVMPAIDHAAKVGWDRGEIYADADREFGQWLIDNAGQ